MATIGRNRSGPAERALPGLGSRPVGSEAEPSILCRRHHQFSDGLEHDHELRVVTIVLPFQFRQLSSQVIVGGQGNGP